MPPVIINLRGDAGAGKDTCKRTICENCDFSAWFSPFELKEYFEKLFSSETKPVVKRYAYADQLKKDIFDIYNLPRDFDMELFGPDGKRLKETYMIGDKTLRQIMIEYGIEKRKNDENYWVNVVYKKILAENPDIAVITDCRFPNEHHFFRDLGFEVIDILVFNPLNKRTTNVADRALDSIEYDYVVVPSYAANALAQERVYVLERVQRGQKHPQGDLYCFSGDTFISLAKLVVDAQMVALEGKLCPF